MSTISKMQSWHDEIIIIANTSGVFKIFIEKSVNYF